MNLQVKIPWLSIFIIMLATVSCGKRPSSVATQVLGNVTTYNITSIPTVFAKPPQTIPSVKLNWAYADPRLFKFNITITGLGSNASIDDLVCNPYITMKEPVQYDTNEQREVKRLTDQPGSPLELTYSYALVSPIQYKSLDVDVLLTLGPCAPYLNFQENNVTPTAPIPPLIANYHFVFQVPVQQ